MELDAGDIIQSIAIQRNAAMDEAARLSAMVQKLTRENELLKKQINEPAPKKPKAEKPAAT